MWGGGTVHPEKLAGENQKNPERLTLVQQNISTNLLNNQFYEQLVIQKIYTYHTHFAWSL